MAVTSPQAHGSGERGTSTSARSQLDRIEAYFGSNAADWQNLYVQPRRVNDWVLAERRQFAVDAIAQHVAPGARILDAGCGAGLVALDLVQRGFFVHGIDIAEGMLELCRKRFADAGVALDRHAFERADVTGTQLPPRSFAGGVALGFLEYQADELAALRALHGLLAPGATLVVSGPAQIKLANYWGLADRVRTRLNRLGIARQGATAARIGLHRYGFARFRGLLRATGFEVVAEHGHGFVELEGLAPRLSYDAQLRIHRTLTWLSRRLPIGRWGNDLIVIARRL